MINWNNGLYTFNRENNLLRFTPHDHQYEAWKCLDFYFNHNKAGIIHVPTGGGKTFIAGKWIWDHIKEGAEILWITNFVSLLEQAALELVRIYNSDIIEETDANVTQTFGFIWQNTAISWSNICNITRPNIIFTTHASATRKKEEVLRYYHDSNQLIVVYDECHHAQGPATFKLLKELKSRSNVILLGITATPKCSNYSNTKKLWSLFDASTMNGNELRLKPIYAVGTADLEEKEIIAKSNFINANSGISEQEIRDACGLNTDQSLFNEFGDFLPCVLDYLSVNNDRLEKTYSVYKNNPHFEKTIIFTINIRECESLYHKFQSKLKEDGNHISVDYAHNKKSDRHEVLNRFQNGELDILINVNMATEGYNAPKTNAIIITRPIRSDSQVLQMIGRGLRGIKAGGNKTCYLVSIVDKWSNDTEIIDLKTLYEKQGITTVVIESALAEIAEFFNKIYPRYPPHPMMHKHWYLPYAYFEIDDRSREDDPNLNIYQKFMLIPQHQWGGLNAYCNSEKIIPEKDVLDHYFFDCPEPLPSIDEIAIINDLVSRGLFFDALVHVKHSDLIKSAPKKSSRKTDLFKKFYHKEEEEHQKKYYLEWNQFFINTHSLVDNTPCHIKEKISSSLSKTEKFTQYLQDIYSGMNFPGNIIFTAFDSKYCADKRLGFCRITKDMGVIIAINNILNRKIVPRMVFEFLMFHLSLRAKFPYDPLGLIFTVPNHNQFNPSDVALEELETPEMNLLYNHFSSEYLSITKLKESPNVSFCRGFLMAFGAIVEGDGEIFSY